MAKVSKKGQIVFPVEWIKALGGLIEGDLLFLHLDETNRIIWVSKKKHHDKVVTASMLSENQLTIPRKIRELFEIQSGDTIDFGFSSDQNHVYFKKRLDTLTCPICSGSGNIEGYKCAVCRENGIIEVEKFQHQFLRFTSRTLEYGIAVSYSWDEFDPTTGKITPSLYPRVRMFSKEYPQHLLDRMQDYYQMKVIDESTPRSISDAKLFQTPSDALLSEILALLSTDNAKNEVKSWFRGERTIFQQTI